MRQISSMNDLQVRDPAFASYGLYVVSSVAFDGKRRLAYDLKLQLFDSTSTWYVTFKFDLLNQPLDLICLAEDASVGCKFSLSIQEQELLTAAALLMVNHKSIVFTEVGGFLIGQVRFNGIDHVYKCGAQITAVPEPLDKYVHIYKMLDNSEGIVAPANLKEARALVN